jgi:hypothetical protein
LRDDLRGLKGKRHRRPADPGRHRVGLSPAKPAKMDAQSANLNASHVFESSEVEN